ncbi:uncharacterized protein LOC135338519 [Halichondria panicea]|uniref:uncharacterized protein LOC135338519 n=1 Tax=Halichondria panicea TaxID=6063 RepID=UPI00312B3D9E
MAETIQKDYSYYRRWTYEFPIGILTAILIVGLISIILTSICRKVLPKWTKKSYVYPWQIRFFLDGFRDAMLRTTNFLLFEFEHEKAVEKHEYRLYGIQVHLYVLQYLFIVLLTILSFCVLTFWNNFLAESTVDSCDSLYDCFPIHRANQTPISIPAITNCDDFSINENTTVLCYRLVYRYSEGLGEAGGFLFSMQVITNLLIYCVVRMVRAMLKITKIALRRKISQSNDQKLDKKRVFCISIISKVLVVSIVVVLYSLIFVLCPLWLLLDRQDFEETLRTPDRQLQLYLYEYTIFVLFLIPCIVGVGIYSSQLFDSIDVEAYINPPEVQRNTGEQPQNDQTAESQNKIKAQRNTQSQNDQTVENQNKIKAQGNTGEQS